MKNTEQELKNLSDSLKLRASEKAAHRETILSFVRANPQAMPSPYAPFVFGFLRYAVAIVLVLAVTGTGVSFAAERSVPGDALYFVKVKVNEPTMIALTNDPEKRAALEVALVEKRLKEFAEASAKEDLNEGTTNLVVDSLSDRLEGAHADILTLRAEGIEASAALDTAVDLYATLAAHTEVLERISEENPDASEDIEEVRTTIASRITVTESVATALRRAVDGEGEATVGVALMAKQAETSDSIEAVSLMVAENPEVLDTDDREAVDDAITQIRNVVEAASDESARGDRKRALKLYGEVDEQVTRLKTLIEADSSLGLDIIERSTRDTDTGQEELQEEEPKEEESILKGLFD